MKITSILASGAIALVAVGGSVTAASASSAAPAAPAIGGSCSVSVQAKTSGAFSNNKDVLGPGVVPGSVFVLATQGPPGTINPAVTGFGPGTGYTVSADWSTVTLQTPYAGSNDGFTTHYAVFVNPCHAALTTGTSGAFSNNKDVIQASNIVPGSVFVVATVGQTAGQDNPSVNDYQFGLKGYTVTYTQGGAIATLLAPFAGSNDGFTTYYTTSTPAVTTGNYGDEVNPFGNGFDVYQQHQYAGAIIAGWTATQADPATHFLRLNGTHPGAVRFEYAPNGVATGLCVSDPGGGWASDPLPDGLILTSSNNGPWQQFIPQPDGTLKNLATGLVVNPNGTGAQLRGGTAPTPWGGSVYTWTDYAHLPR